MRLHPLIKCCNIVRSRVDRFDIVAERSTRVCVPVQRLNVVNDSKHERIMRTQLFLRPSSFRSISCNIQICSKPLALNNVDKNFKVFRTYCR